MGKQCLVQLNEKGEAIRIIGTAKLARLLPVEEVAEWDRAHAVRSIRWQIYERSKNDEGYAQCEWCGRSVIFERGHPNSGEMHERTWRGRRNQQGNSGEISVENSVFICKGCHFGPNAHGTRAWQSAKKEQ